MNLGKWEIDDFVTFTCNTHDPETGAATDADAVPSYRVYEDETGTPILTGVMALLDSANTAGYYSERIQLTAASGFEDGKSYSIYISATVNSTEGTLSHALQIGAAGTAPTVGQIADAVWDEPIADHTTVTQFGGKNQKVVPSETIADYKADVSALALEATLAVVDGIVDSILVDTGTTLPAEHSALATAAALATHDGKLDTVDTVVDAIKAVTDLLPDAGALTTIDGNIDSILVDTGTTLPAEHALLATAAALATHDGKLDTVDTVVDAIQAVTDNLPDSGQLLDLALILTDTGTTLPAQIGALENLSAANVQTVLETNDLDHLLKIAHPTGDPVASTIFDLVMNKDGSQTFDRADDSLEAISDGESTAPTAAQVADAVWDEDIADHTTSTKFGGKNQKVVPSETLADYKADVSALATSAALATVDSVVDAIKLITDALPDSGQLLDLALILTDTGTTLPAEHATLSGQHSLLATAASIALLNNLSSSDIQTVLETNDLDHLAKVAHPTGDPVADTLIDLIMNKDGSQTFARATDSLEGQTDGGGTPPSAAVVAAAVWDEAISGHTGGTTFGGKNQIGVPSATLNDYKADVSGLATSAALATVDTVVDAIKAVTDLLPDAGALTTIDSNIDAIKAVTDLIPDAGAMSDLALILADTTAILVDTGTSLPATLATLATAAALATVDGNVDAILVDTGTTIPASITAMQSDVDDVLVDTGDILTDTAAILSDTSDILDDTALILAAVGGGPPAGALTFVYNVTNQVSGNPIGDVDVWVTTDEPGANVVASGKTDAFGNVTFYLDAGTYYLWSQKSGFNFENPDTEVVS